MEKKRKCSWFDHRLVPEEGSGRSLKQQRSLGIRQESFFKYPADSNYKQIKTERNQDEGSE